MLSSLRPLYQPGMIAYARSSKVCVRAFGRYAIWHGNGPVKPHKLYPDGTLAIAVTGNQIRFLKS